MRRKNCIHYTYRVSHIVFRLFMSLLIEGLAIMGIKSYLPAFSIENNERSNVCKVHISYTEENLENKPNNSNEV